MNITIVGTGNVGTGLALAFARAGHGVALAGRTTEAGRAAATAFEQAHHLRVQGDDVPSAVALSEFVFLAVPYSEVANVAAAADFAGKTVVDVTNPLTEDFSGLTLGHTTSAAEEIAGLVPKASVVKAFNTVFAQLYAKGADFGDRKAAVFVASDDAAAKARVSGIASDAGFDPVDAGPLANARLLEPLAAMNIQLGYMLGHGTDIVPAWLSR